MNTLLKWIIDRLNNTDLSEFVMDNAYAFVALEMAHFLGLSLLFGSLLVVDLRLLGLAQSAPIQHVPRFLRFALIGFAINMVSGALFVVGDSDRYLVNIAFGVKMMLILFAGLNTAYFVRRIKPQMDRGVAFEDLSKDTKLVAWLSLTLWICVIILGRFIPYVE